MRMGWLRVLVPLAILASLLWLLDPQEVAAALLQLSGHVLAAAFLLALSDRALMAYKWRQLVRAGGARFPFPDALRIQFQAGVSSRVVPFALGGDLLRAWLAARTGVPRGLAVGSITIEKGIGMLAAALFGVAGLVLLSARTPSGEHNAFLIGSALLALLASIGAFGLLFHPPAHRAGGRLLALLFRSRAVPERLAHLPGKISRALLRFRNHPGSLAVNALLALLEHLVQLVKVVVLGFGVGIMLPIVPFLAIAAVALLVRRTAGLLESWGLGEGGAVMVFALFGVPAEQAVALLIANFAMTTVVLLPGILLFYTHPIRSSPKSDAHDVA